MSSRPAKTATPAAWKRTKQRPKTFGVTQPAGKIKMLPSVQSAFPSTIAQTSGAAVFPRVATYSRNPEKGKRLNPAYNKSGAGRAVRLLSLVEKSVISSPIAAQVAASIRRVARKNVEMRIVGIIFSSQITAMDIAFAKAAPRRGSSSSKARAQNNYLRGNGVNLSKP